MQTFDYKMPLTLERIVDRVVHKHEILADRMSLLGGVVKKTLKFLRERQLESACLIAAAEVHSKKRFDALEKRLKDVELQLEEFTCSICCENYRNTVLLPCRHAMFCESCVKSLYAHRDEPLCPICRAPIDCFVVVQT
jgi:hypothetical protein